MNVTSERASGSASVLVADDDPVNRMLLAKSLERDGHRVTTAEDGGQAWDLVRRKPFDVVLLDVGSELKVWAHRVTPEGDSEALAARAAVRLGNEASEFDLALSRAQMVVPVTASTCTVEIVFTEA